MVDEKAPTMRDLVDRSRAALTADLSAADTLEDGVRRRLRKMADNGDLALIGSILDYLSREEAMTFLGYVSSQDVEVLRGKLIGFRQFFAELMDRGDYPDQVESQGNDEMNPFRVGATSLDNPFVVGSQGLTSE